jgi:hypothetical protein
MSFLAPQAYTKETLSKAFDWLQYQPDSVKQVATSPDVLVSLFLKAQRQGIDNIDIDAPVSSKKFLTDLKNLKKDFAPFEESLGGAPQNNSMQTQVSQQMSQQVSQTVTVTETKAATIPFQTAYMQSLDPNSLQAVYDVQARFNLSTPQEALRMLISIGAKQVRQWP